MPRSWTVLVPMACNAGTEMLRFVRILKFLLNEEGSYEE